MCLSLSSHYMSREKKETQKDTHHIADNLTKERKEPKKLPYIHMCNFTREFVGHYFDDRMKKKKEKKKL